MGSKWLIGQGEAGFPAKNQLLVIMTAPLNSVVHSFLVDVGMKKTAKAMKKESKDTLLTGVSPTLSDIVTKVGLPKKGLSRQKIYDFCLILAQFVGLGPSRRAAYLVVMRARWGFQRVVGSVVIWTCVAKRKWKSCRNCWKIVPRSTRSSPRPQKSKTNRFWSHFLRIFVVQRGAERAKGRHQEAKRVPKGCPKRPKRLPKRFPEEVLGALLDQKGSKN